MSEHGATLPLRHAAWGEPESREAIQRIASDIRARSGFGTCVVEVVRADGLLEYVAIIGDEETSAALTSAATPFSTSEAAASLGTTYGWLTFVPAEAMTHEVLADITTYGHVPSIAQSPDPDAWQANDALVARLVTEQGLVRGFVWLDEPHTGRRLTPDELTELSAELELALRSLLTTIERDDLAQVGRSVVVAREIIRSASVTAGESAMLDEVAMLLRWGFDASDVRFLLREAPEPDSALPVGPVSLDPDVAQALLDVGARLANDRSVLLIEPDEIWGDSGLDSEISARLQEHLSSHGLSTLVVVPISGGADPLGVFVIARPTASRRWLAAETEGVSELGRDLGLSLLAARAQERERELVAKLQTLDAYRTGLIATISHEMKTPLTAIHGHLELLEDELGLSAGALRSLNVIERSTSLLVTLAEDLLGLSRAETDPSTLDLSTIDLVAVLQDVVELALAQAQAQGVIIEMSVPDEPVLLLAVTEDLQRVLANLVSNAVKYSNPGGVVSLAVRVLDGQVEFSCRDQGLGISSEDLERLFDEFFRSTNAEVLARPGTGLGLPIVRRIVERYGGQIDVASEPGRGSTFTVTLPVRG